MPPLGQLLLPSLQSVSCPGCGLSGALAELGPELVRSDGVVDHPPGCRITLELGVIGGCICLGKCVFTEVLLPLLGCQLRHIFVPHFSHWACMVLYVPHFGQFIDSGIVFPFPAGSQAPTLLSVWPLIHQPTSGLATTRCWC